MKNLILKDTLTPNVHMFITAQFARNSNVNISRCMYTENVVCACVYIYVYTHIHTYTRASLVAQLVKNPPTIQETLVQFLGQEDPLEKE